ncbi:MAG: primosomal replication protein N [Betaproteobacteria bacterium]|nr:primosomal replication protein N [Betaproteobacteria bacterium]
MENSLNRFVICGTVIERQALRYTPAGVAVVECRICHESEQDEAGQKRRVECEIPLIGMGEAAKWLQGASPGMQIRCTGFVAAKSRNSKQLVLHVEQIDFL